ncbi:outer membrane protein assembly factor BamE [Solimonas sp. K1W22B-7]|uniref:outer membrane protein assembly factor BamE n=1 Tax=Solimonas sp. K1W22B-7 TaxID=2303331 RepID=UPI000E32E212|nr:outer membrane protein assembly factor BamE [Solimonas sp. K1W22B-7]AXQ29263.1 outer membrane protein assembly factor BamE [Solimonas sp. K1W22B-7]
MRVILLVLGALALSACQIVYKLPTRQGNVIEQKQLDQLQTGMTREQVRFLMGTPVAASPFEDRRWDYVGYYKSPRGKVSSRVVSVYFESEKVARLEGVKALEGEKAADKALENPDVKTVLREDKKAQAEDTRVESEQGKESGVILTPDRSTP